MALFGHALIRVAVFVFAGGSALVGLYIGYLAYRGVRRHDSRQMVALCVGMILLFGVAYGVSIVGSMLIQFRVLPLPHQDLFRLAVRVTQFTGLVCIAYSLSMGREADG